jgi:cytochrome c553
MGAVFAAGLCLTSPRGHAQDNGNGGDSRIAHGFDIAPVRLDLTHRNRALVGLGSYLVNAVAACGDCHSNPTYLPGGNPYFGQPKMVNAAGYLGGGQAFGPFLSRNITPDKTGMPEGRTFADFLLILRTGVDMERVHPQISPLLQVMPWPVYQNMTDHEIQAIYEYLSAIPCVEGGPFEPASRCK